jgi:hypothetical protein
LRSSRACRTAKVDDDELGFDPKTLAKKSAEDEAIEESAESIQSGFSLGD